MICPKCQSPVEENMRFCGECGCPLPEIAPAVEEPAVEETPVVEEVPAVEEVSEPAVEETAPAEEAAPEVVVCSKCGTANQPGDAFCMKCGNKLGGEVVPQEPPTTVYCPKCGQGNRIGDAFCMKCAQSLAGIEPSHVAPVIDNTSDFEKKAKEAAQKAGKLAKKGAEKASKLAKEGAKEAKKLAKEGAKKAKELTEEGKKLAEEGAKEAKKLPKGLLIGGIAAVVVIALVAGFLLFSGIFGGAKGDSDPLLYIKDEEIVFDSMKKDPMEVTTRLVDDSSVDNDELAEAAYVLGSYIIPCGDRIFFPDKVGDTDGLTIYYRDLNKPKKEAEKLDSDIMAYAVDAAGKTAIYLKADGKLYLSNLKDKEKIASDVADFYVSEDLKSILIVTYENDVYSLNQKGEKEKVVSEVGYIEKVSEDLKTVWYMKDNNLYKQEVGGDKEKLASDVYSVVQLYDDGSMYYVTVEEQTIKMWDFVDDDMAAQDEGIEEPVWPEGPAYPEYPYYWEYETDEEYEAAYEEYERLEEEYYATWEQLEEEYYAAYDRYNEASDRIWMREDLQNWEEYQSVYTLHYFDGKDTVVVDTNLANSWMESYGYDGKAVAYTLAPDAGSFKVKLSELESSWDVYDRYTEALNGGEGTWKIAVKGVASGFEDEEIYSVVFSDDGSEALILSEVDTEKNEGTLRKASIKAGKDVTSEVLDEDVAANACHYLSNGSYCYFKDMNRDGSAGDMYIDGKKADSDVYPYSVSLYEEIGNVVYYADYDWSKGGTLKMLKGKEPVKIADDVNEWFVYNGQILVMTDYNDSRYIGDLSVFKGNKLEKIAEDVVAVLRYMGTPGEVCGDMSYYYGGYDYDYGYEDFEDYYEDYAAADWY